MLNLGKLAAGPGAGRYYVDRVAQGREDYYSGEGEAPGVWHGGAAAALGLSGEVSEEGIVGLLQGRDPRSGELLGRAFTEDSVAGFDLTFRAPKSVSILFGIADAAVAREVVAAHEAAVAEAMKYVEREACRARRGQGGALVVKGNGFLGAAFRHRASRAGDPLLHTHVVVANLTQGPDGRWTALHGQLLYRHAKTAGYLYQSVLRAELTERLHVRWNAVEHGMADIAGVPREVIEHFSQRRAEVLEHMAARGERSARAAQIATLDTRRRKDHDVPAHRLREDWKARAAEHGLDRVRLRRVLGQPPRRLRHDELGAERLARHLEGADGLTREKSSFTRRDVLQAFAEAARDGAPAARLEGQATAFLSRAEIVPLSAAGGEPRYTTRELLELERGLLDGATGRRAGSAGLADASAVDLAVGGRPTLSAEQRHLVGALTGSGDGVQIVRAAAGTGKTFALGAAVEAWQASGVPVLGCALSARAACELRDSTGIDATTIARLKLGFDQGAELAPGSVLLVDEAGMVGTRDLSCLAHAAQDANGKLVLVGDDRQLPEIEAGGAFTALADRLGAVELSQVHRQAEPWDREALTALRQGDVESFATAYERHGRIEAAPSADAARAAMAQAWCDAHAAGDSAVMIAHRRTDVAKLNARARGRLRAAGRLGNDVLNTSERGFAIGDRVVITRNNRALGVANGQTGTIAGLRHQTLEIRFDDGHWVALPEPYVRAGHLDHGYALTAHRAQGATVDRAFVLGSDELYREWGYTALSRHRIDSRFYVTATATYLNQPPAALQPGADATAKVARMLAPSGAKTIAADGIDEAGVHREALGSQLQQLRDAHAETRWYQRTRRADLEHQINACRHELRTTIPAAPERPEPDAPRPGRDPLARLERTPQRVRQHDRGLEL
jgi:Ti-type conjugative transfer relaxase TraA